MRDDLLVSLFVSGCESEVNLAADSLRIEESIKPCSAIILCFQYSFVVSLFSMIEDVSIDLLQGDRR